ncbi:MAG: ABC-type transport system involved in cytochrome c biogenesis permease subunit [Kiritimatiellia bacterium]
MERLLYIVPIVLYALLALDHLIPRAVGLWVARHGRWLAGVGCAVHGLGLVVSAVINDSGPGFPEALSTAALGIMLAYTIVVTGKVRALGLLLAPLAVVVLSTAMVVPSHRVLALEQTGASLWLPIHLGLIFSGLAGFALAFAVGCLYLFVRARLKAKKLAGLKRFPSLEVLDRIQFRSMLFGFAFLTLGIGAGGAWAAAAFEGGWSLDPKVIFTLVIWAWYGIALQVRLVAGWRGRWSALFSIIGFAGLVFSLIGMNFLVSGWHGYGA